MKNTFIAWSFAFVFLVFIATVANCRADAPRQSVHRWICSTEAVPWKQMPISPATQPIDPAAVVTIDPTTTYQRIDGFGGCFNELGWDALQKANEGVRQEVLKALFGPDGCDFSICRVPIGANDFARGWYSYDETPDDFSMSRFSIDNDRQTLIPYIKSAMKYQPRLAIWGVPWSPPSWLKTNNSYKVGRMKQDPKYLAAYAIYFSKYVQAYRAAGINLYAIHPQNEPCTDAGNYPICVWNGDELKNFVAGYLSPRLKQDDVHVQVWFGTINNEHLKDFAGKILGDPATAPLITGVGYQYQGQPLFKATHEAFPRVKLMQTETECYNGENNWEQGLKTFGKMASELDAFANAYMYWNMILDEKATSSWGWHQNSMVNIDSKTQTVRYNPSFYALKHFSAFLPPGSTRILAQGGPLHGVAAFKTPSGEVVILCANPGKKAVTIDITTGAASPVEVELPAKSMNTIVVGG